MLFLEQSQAQHHRIYFGRVGTTSLFRNNFSSTMFNAIHTSVNTYKHLSFKSNVSSGLTCISASVDKPGGSITTATGNMTSTTCNSFQTIVSGKAGPFQNLTCTGTIGKPTTPSSACVYIGTGSTVAGGIETCFTSLQTMIPQHLLVITKEG